MTRLTVIVPATDTPATLARCTAAIAGAHDPPEELMVVRECPAPGPAAARNQAAGQATGDVLVFVDSDVEVHPDVFRRIRGAFRSDPSLTAIFGSYDDRPEPNGVISGFRNLLHHHVHQRSAGPATTFWAGLGAVRRDAFLNAGGFDDQRYRGPSVEDIELGMRLSAGGARIRLDQHLLGKHLKHWTLPSMVRSDLLDRGIPWARLLLRSGSPWRGLNLGWGHRLSALAAVVVVVGGVGRRSRVVLGGLAVLVGVNRSFYALLWRRQGPRVIAQVPLHVVHHLAAAVSVPAAATAHLVERHFPRAIRAWPAGPAPRRLRPGRSGEGRSAAGAGSSPLA